MSSAAVVPETQGLTGDDAVSTLRRVETRRFVADATMRLRAADGMSHARATAFQLVLALLPGTIVVVALAAVMHWGGVSTALSNTVETVAPGRSSQVFRDAFERGRHAARGGDWAAVIGGGIALVVAGATAFGQIERAANRIYGVEQDRRSIVKYGQAMGLLVTAGLLLVAFVGLVAVGGGADVSNGAVRIAWAVGRWILGAGVLLGALLLIFRVSPRRRQPELRWLLPGALVSAGLALTASLLLGLYLQGSGTFGDTYGPLAGVVGLLLWAYACCLALVVGLAVAAQLEALRAGAPAPRSEDKVDAGEPDRAAVSYGAALSTAITEEHR